MATAAPDYGSYFVPSRPVNVSHEHADGEPCAATVTAVRGEMAWLELDGAEPSSPGLVWEGNEVTVSVWTGGALCRCLGSVEKGPTGRQMVVRLHGPVRELQRREHFRFDLHLPVRIESLAGLSHEEIEARWCAHSPGLPDGEPPSAVFSRFPSRRVNLSGGGIRFGSVAPVAPGTMLLLYLSLPLDPQRVVCAVAEVLRCRELALAWKRGTSYAVSMRFLRLEEKDREAIISLLFAEQRRQLLERNAPPAAGGGP